MTTKQGMLLLGRRGMLRDRRGLSIPVKVIDSRQVFGRVDVLVEPVHGEGSMWVAEKSLHTQREIAEPSIRKYEDKQGLWQWLMTAR